MKVVILTATICLTFKLNGQWAEGIRIRVLFFLSFLLLYIFNCARSNTDTHN